MRWHWIAAFGALLLAAPAQADITARFAQTSRPPMVVEVRDNGDSRITVNDGFYLRRDGAAYMILSDTRGTFAARQEDFVALIRELMGAAPELQPPGDSQVSLGRQGEETVGGRRGTRFRLKFVGSANPEETLDVVISDDPELAPVGRAMEAQLAPLLSASMTGTPGLFQGLADLMARGTVIRFGFLWELESVATGPVDAAAFELPGPVLSGEALRERLGTLEPTEPGTD